jgi:choline kinase
LIIQVATLGVHDFVFVTGAAETVIQQECIRVLSDIPHNSVVFVRNHEYASTGNWVSLQCANKYLKGNVIVLEGDVVFDDFPRAQPPAWITVVGYTGDGCFVTLNNQRQVVTKEIIRDRSETTVPDLMEKSAGVFFLDDKCARALAADLGEYEYIDDAMEKLVLPAAYVGYGWWREVDTVQDFEDAREAISGPIAYKPDPVLR